MHTHGTIGAAVVRAVSKGGGAGWEWVSPAPHRTTDFPGSWSGSLTSGKSCSLDLERGKEVRATQMPGVRGGLQGRTSSVTCG